MNEPYVPDGYSRLCPYLTVIDAARLIDFIVAVFGASVEGRHERPDGKIMHAALRIGDSQVEISDPSEQWGPTPSAIHIYVPDVDVVYRRALEHGARSLMAPTDMDYGERGCAVRDAHGNNWYIATYLRDKATAGTASS
jgi:PhnB protein